MQNYICIHLLYKYNASIIIPLFPSLLAVFSAYLRVYSVCLRVTKYYTETKV